MVQKIVQKMVQKMVQKRVQSMFYPMPSINSFNTAADVHFSSYPATFTRRVIISILPATRDLPDDSTYQC